MKAVDWDAELTAAAQRRNVPEPKAVTFLRGPWQSASQPVCVKCDDGVARVLKGFQAGGRMLFNDQVIARLGRLIGAPVPEPALVQLPQDLIAAEPKLAHMPAAMCHGSTFHDEHSDRLNVAHHDLPANRPRFASLAILYGWAHASDHQQIYPNAPPPLVLSVDHGHFIGNGEPNWTIELLKTRPAAHADQLIAGPAALTATELAEAAVPLDALTPQQLADVLAVPPETWGVASNERIALAEYLWKRRTDLLKSYASKPAAGNIAGE